MIYAICRKCKKKGKCHPIFNPHFKKDMKEYVILCDDCVKIAQEVVVKWVDGE